MLWHFYTFIQIIYIKCFVWAVQSKLFEKKSVVLKYVRLHSEFTPCPHISYDGQFRQLAVQLCINSTYMGCWVSSDLVQISSCLFVCFKGKDFMVVFFYLILILDKINSTFYWINFVVLIYSMGCWVSIACSDRLITTEVKIDKHFPYFFFKKIFKCEQQICFYILIMFVLYLILVWHKVYQ